MHRRMPSSLITMDAPVELLRSMRREARIRWSVASDEAYSFFDMRISVRILGMQA